MNLTELERAAEAVLLAAGEAVKPDELAAALGVGADEAQNIALGLRNYYQAEQRGLQIVLVDGGYQMCSNPAYSEYVFALAKVPRRRVLTNALTETLAIIAYRQPVTKAEIEEIRGVNADHAVNRLMEYNLVREAGRAAAPGRPILLAVTEDFLRYFGYDSLDSLPDLPEPNPEENAETELLSTEGGGRQM